MKFPFEKLHFLKSRGLDDRRPAEKWGGYSTDLEANPNVYSHEEVAESNHEGWLVNGYRNGENMKHHLLVFDLDVYKAPDGFDPDRVTVPEDTPIVKSQSGGLHVYFVVSSPAKAQESDFKLQDHVPFDIDIRGEYVKHHVVAPADIPGVGGGYELVNDADIQHVFTPAEAAKRVQVDGEPALRYDPGGVAGSSAGYEREDLDPPEELPKCYGAGLSLRAEAPEDPDLNTHKVNVLTALAGLASGYDVKTVVEHFVEDFYPGAASHADRDRTRYQVEHIARKLDSGEYSPPSIESLRKYGILPLDESCNCGLPGHDGNEHEKSPYYSVDLAHIGQKSGIEGNPYEEPKAMLAAALQAREEYTELDGSKPPYKALLAVAKLAGLDVADPDEGILGESTYKVARRIFDDLEPGEIAE